MDLLVKAWGKDVGKIKVKNGISYFSLSPYNKLNFSPIKLPQKDKIYEFSHLRYQNGLPGLINDSLPGVYGKEYLDTFFLKHLGFKPTYLETLQFLGENTMGALTYEPELKHSVDRKNIILDAKELYQETKNALTGEADFSINEIIAISNSAASGARHKAIVGFNPETKKMFVGEKYKLMPNGYVHSIVKFDDSVFKVGSSGALKENNSIETKGEYIYSVLAKASGIYMPNTYLVEAGGSCHFVVERFDIEKREDTVARKHIHSLSGIMHQNPAETTFDYTNLFRIGERLNISHKDKEQFFKTMVFNLVFGNCDDHTRNFSYLMSSDGEWSSAPAYDLTFSYKKRHQMLFDYKNGFNIKFDDIQNIADKFNISGAKEIVQRMVDLKRALLPELAAQYGVESWAGDVAKFTRGVLEGAFNTQILNSTPAISAEKMGDCGVNEIFRHGDTDGLSDEEREDAVRALADGDSGLKLG
ncbi:MAG: hypothetical protein A3F91_09135 [Flavobacteria bacterium RIFCSPLOWO2_12_FULL_35_11]|nr:MAG: hypothetical protein A3F91_09135 [Flavobacteria bacterium RIFCSPLOWO2_12_FULL_35_11]